MNFNKIYKMNFITLTLLLSVCSISCYPSKPLNERSKELAWQAWLLIDDQNQNKQNDPDMFARRRITPKSVFIAPTFSPDKLQPCDAGYVYDTNGKCRMIVKIDEAPYLEFLLQKLNEKYAESSSADSDDTTEGNKPTPGPFQVNIPLGNAEKSVEQYDNSPDIIVSSDYSDLDSTKVKRTDGPSSQIDNKAGTTTQDTTTFETTTMLQTTTVTEDVTFPDIYTTTIQDTAETETTTEVAHALFFVNDVKNDSFPNDDIPLHEIPNGSIIIGSRIKDGDFVRDAIDTTNSNDDAETSSSQEPQLQSETTLNIRYPNPYQDLPKPIIEQTFHPDPNPMQNDKAENEETNTQKQFDRLYEDYIISRGSDLKANERHIFKSQTVPTNNNNNLHHQRIQQAEFALNHRNRDKHFWNLPTDWGDVNVIVSNRQSPLNDVNLQQPKVNQEQIYNRQVPPAELSYIFGGIKRMPRNTR